MFGRMMLLGVISLGLCAPAVCQQTTCQAVEIQVGVIGITGESFRGLAAEDFVGRTQKKPVKVKALAFDASPRRILLVVDANKKLSADSRKAEAEMVQTLAATLRPEDKLGMLVARGPGQDVEFTLERAAITQALNQPGEGKRGKEPGILDTVMAAIERFGEAQPGDAIILIAADTAGNHKSNAKLVAQALEKHHIRMFGLALGPVQTKSSVATTSITSTTSQGLALSKPVVGDTVFDTGDENFYPLTTNSGGLVLAAMNGDSHKSYNISDAHVLQEVRQKARSVARMVIDVYRMQIEPPQLAHPEAWELEIDEEMRKHSQPMFVLYPRELGPC